MVSTRVFSLPVVSTVFTFLVLSLRFAKDGIKVGFELFPVRDRSGSAAFRHRHLHFAWVWFFLGWTLLLSKVHELTDTTDAKAA